MPRLKDDEQRFHDLLHPLLLEGRNDMDLDALSAKAGVTPARGLLLFRTMKRDKRYPDLRLIPPKQTDSLGPVQETVVTAPEPAALKTKVEGKKKTDPPTKPKEVKPEDKEEDPKPKEEPNADIQRQTGPRVES